VLLDGEEAELVPLGEVLDAVGRADEVLEVDDRDVAVPIGSVDARDLQLRLVDEDRADVALEPDVRGEPRLDDEHAARLEVTAHRGHRGAETLDRPDVADAAEHADDGI